MVSNISVVVWASEAALCALHVLGEESREGGERRELASTQAWPQGWFSAFMHINQAIRE